MMSRQISHAVGMRQSLALVGIALLSACGSSEPARQTEAVDERSAVSEAGKVPASVDPRPVVVAFGDSLTAGQRVARDETYPAFLQREFDRRGRGFRVVNEGASGDTTAVALSRTYAAIAHKPTWVILALGANDGLRGLPLDAMESNLREIVKQLEQSQAKVILAGMKLPRNYGPEYVRDFEAVYPKLARELDLPFIPFLLENVAMVRDLNNEDGIHPNAKGNQIVARLVADSFDKFAAD